MPKMKDLFQSCFGRKTEPSTTTRPTRMPRKATTALPRRHKSTGSISSSSLGSLESIGTRDSNKTACSRSHRRPPATEVSWETEAAIVVVVNDIVGTWSYGLEALCKEPRRAAGVAAALRTGCEAAARYVSRSHLAGTPEELARDYEALRATLDAAVVAAFDAAPQSLMPFAGAATVDAICEAAGETIWPCMEGSDTPRSHGRWWYLGSLRVHYLTHSFVVREFERRNPDIPAFHLAELGIVAPLSPSHSV